MSLILGIPHFSVEQFLDPNIFFSDIISAYGENEILSSNDTIGDIDQEHEDQESGELEGLVMKEGMTFTIEPVVLECYSPLLLLPDHWSIVTKNGAWSASHEHTVLITRDGSRILTGD